MTRHHNACRLCLRDNPVEIDPDCALIEVPRSMGYLAIGLKPVQS